ncbi:MAG: peroxidase [Planctomycetes bacterium]|nr:peroxidase [Planctomycetota bacterium]MBL7008912.1 peroxidase [Planctomycetota bacterium]
MRAHAHDLRAEVGEAELADHLAERGWIDAPLSDGERAACAYAEKLTRAPDRMSERDVVALREQGWSDREIHDICQVVAYFNYINRVADGLGIDPEDWLA